MTTSNETWRYDRQTGVLWLNETYAIDLAYDARMQVWLVGRDNPTKYVGESDALNVARTALRSAASEQSNHVQVAQDAMERALNSAGITIAAAPA